MSGVTGTLLATMIVTDGGAHIGPLSPLQTTSFSSGLATVLPSYYSSIAPETMYGTLASVIPGQYIIASGITTPVSITGVQAMTPCPTTGFPLCGTYTLSNSANTVGSIGAPVAMTLTGIGDGGALAPGPALTIKDIGPGATFVATSISCASYGNCTGTGSIPVSGTFDTSVLGGMPTTIQGQVSVTAGGPPISGCTACAWMNLSSYSATLSSGTVWKWSGTTLNIPARAGSAFRIRSGCQRNRLCDNAEPRQNGSRV